MSGIDGSARRAPREVKMLPLVKLTLCLVLLAASVAEAGAKPRRSGQAAPAQTQDPNAIKLPQDLTSNKYWLEDEEAATHGPTGESRMLRQQENFQLQDPTRNTGAGQRWYER
jgi:hypothetical protein